MTGEDVIKAAELLRRWRELHAFRSSLHKVGANIRDITGEVCDGGMLHVAFEGAREALDAYLDKLIQDVHDQALKLGAHPPFPTKVEFG